MWTFSSLCEQGYSLVQLPGLPSRWALLQGLWLVIPSGCHVGVQCLWLQA